MVAIKKLLVANRGEIACRIIRTCHKLSIKTVAVYSPADANALFVTQSDEAVLLSTISSSSADTYLNIDRIVQIAKERGVDAVHPGYGFLSENDEFCKKVEEAGIIFVGPTSSAIKTMGSKIGAKQLLSKYDASIPLIPGYQGDDQSDARLIQEALRVGFPVLIKASAGGGGRGLRVVRKVSGDNEETLKKKLLEAIESARSEAKSAFGDDSLLIEKYFDKVRHIEIQIVGDSHKNVTHLFERECTVQRRHQKVIEEAPSPIMTPELRAKMGKAAVKIGKSIDYKSLGTVEFIVDNDTMNFYFLEVNTRLQVEHPVTEEITGLDLVELQIRIAQGASLKDLLLIDAHGLPTAKINGHAIEVRIYAEDPLNNFFPCTGTLLGWRESHIPGIRYDTGVGSGSEISIYYDPMITKLIAYAPTRAEAIQKLDLALATTSVLGLQTNQTFLRQILQHPAFCKGDMDTGFIANHIPPEEILKFASQSFTKQNAETAAAVALIWEFNRRKQRQTVLRHVSSGWRNNPYAPQRQTFAIGAVPLKSDIETKILPIEYSTRTTNEGTIFDINAIYSTDDNVTQSNNKFTAVFHRSGKYSQSTSIYHEWLEATINGVRSQFDVATEESLLNYPHGDSVLHIHSSAFGALKAVLKSRFAVGQGNDSESDDEKYVAQMPGKILKILIADGSTVTKGDPVMVMESMKIESKVLAHRNGKISIKVKELEIVDENTTLLTIS